MLDPSHWRNGYHSNLAYTRLSHHHSATMKSVLALASLLTLSAAQSTVYLIRHGEKPSDGSNGLSSQGMQRAQCLRNVFGASSMYDIGYIMAETPKSSTSSPYPSIHFPSSRQPTHNRLSKLTRRSQAAPVPDLTTP